MAWYGMSYDQVAKIRKSSKKFAPMILISWRIRNAAMRAGLGAASRAFRKNKEHQAASKGGIPERGWIDGPRKNGSAR